MKPGENTVCEACGNPIRELSQSINGAEGICPICLKVVGLSSAVLSASESWGHMVCRAASNGYEDVINWLKEELPDAIRDTPKLRDALRPIAGMDQDRGLILPRMPIWNFASGSHSFRHRSSKEPGVRSEPQGAIRDAICIPGSYDADRLFVVGSVEAALKAAALYQGWRVPIVIAEKGSELPELELLANPKVVVAIGGLAWSVMKESWGGWPGPMLKLAITDSELLKMQFLEIRELVAAEAKDWNNKQGLPCARLGIGHCDSGTRDGDPLYLIRDAERIKANAHRVSPAHIAELAKLEPGFAGWDKSACDTCPCRAIGTIPQRPPPSSRRYHDPGVPRIFQMSSRSRSLPSWPA